MAVSGRPLNCPTSIRRCIRQHHNLSNGVLEMVNDPAEVLDMQGLLCFLSDDVFVIIS